MILVDTGGLIAALDTSDKNHDAAARILEEGIGPFVLSPYVIAETDYMLAEHVGIDAELAFLQELASDAYRIEDFRPADIASARSVIKKYSKLDLRLADASLVVLSERYECLDVLTLDERHFRTVRGARGRPFRLLPADADPNH